MVAHHFPPPLLLLLPPPPSSLLLRCPLCGAFPAAHSSGSTTSRVRRSSRGAAVAVATAAAPFPMAFQCNEPQRLTISYHCNIKIFNNRCKESQQVTAVLPPSPSLPSLPPLCSSVFLCVPLCSSVFLCVPLCSAVFLCVPLCSSVFLCVPLCSSVFLCVPLCSSVFLCVPLCSSVFLCVPLCSSVLSLCRRSRLLRGEHCIHSFQQTIMSLDCAVLATAVRVVKVRAPAPTGPIVTTATPCTALTERHCGGIVNPNRRHHATNQAWQAPWHGRNHGAHCTHGTLATATRCCVTLPCAHSCDAARRHQVMTCTLRSSTKPMPWWLRMRRCTA